MCLRVFEAASNNYEKLAEKKHEELFENRLNDVAPDPKGLYLVCGHKNIELLTLPGLEKFEVVAGVVNDEVVRCHFSANGEYLIT